jgi:hypothetical protein
MTTFNDLIDSTMLQLGGFSTNQDSSTYVTETVSPSALQFAVQDASTLSRGMAELGDELVWVDRVDIPNKQVYIAPYGRGWRGTTAAEHASGSRMAFSPLFPRQQVKQALNQVIAQVFPRLFAVGSTTFTFQATRTTYALPAEAQDVLAVSYDTIGPSREWIPVRRWRVDKMAATSEYPSGRSLSVYDGIVPGRTIHVTFTRKPIPLVLGTDVFADTGLPESCEDVIQFGAAYRLTPFLDVPQLAGLSAEADFVDQNQRSAGAATGVGRYFFQLFQARLSEEADRLRNQLPVRSHYTL